LPSAAPWLPPRSDCSPGTGRLSAAKTRKPGNATCMATIPRSARTLPATSAPCRSRTISRSRRSQIIAALDDRDYRAQAEHVTAQLAVAQADPLALSGRIRGTRRRVRENVHAPKRSLSATSRTSGASTSFCRRPWGYFAPSGKPTPPPTNRQPTSTELRRRYRNARDRWG
jgi:hypothetical protein